MNKLKIKVMLTFIIIAICDPVISDFQNTTTMSGKFLYFGYGSNLLMKRLHIQNPSAKRAGIGKLLNYQLDFVMYSKRWHGAAATVIKNNNREVWGAIWELDLKDMESLDRQEGVPQMYHALEVDIIQADNTTKKCRTYAQCQVAPTTDKIENLATNRLPSPLYTQIIREGAEESNLPEEYQKFLSRIPNNGYQGSIDITNALN